VEVRLRCPTARVAALVYVAGPTNPNFLGPAPLDEMAAQMRTARGKSGANAEYVLRLASALREIGGEDEHVTEVAARLTEG
jgi:cation transport regulator ChaC